MSTNIPTDIFENMDYETAINKLTELIGILERSEGTFDEMMQVYTEAYSYYTYCLKYLNTASEKVKDLNARMSEILSSQEGM